MAFTWGEVGHELTPTTPTTRLRGDRGRGAGCIPHLRQSRYIGLARTHLQHLLTGAAMNGVQVIAWRWGEPLEERRRKPGHFAQLAPHPFITPDGVLVEDDLPNGVRSYKVSCAIAFCVL
jgi:hypothetical protein